MSSNELILYYDERSPPVRSVLLLIDALKIDVIQKKVDLFRGEHRSPEFLNVSRLVYISSRTFLYF